MTVAERLRIAAEHLPPGTAVSVSREDLLEALAAVPHGGDLTVAEVAKRLRRSRSSVRGYLERGELRGYRFRRREWRVTPAAVAEFEERERTGTRQGRRAPTGRSVELGQWRKERSA